MEIEYQNKSKELDLKFEDKKQKLEDEYSEKFNELDNHFNSTITRLEKENNRLNKLLDKFKDTFHKFVHWICKNFTMSNDEDMLIRDFEQETNILIDPEKQLLKEQREKEWDLEL